MTSSGCHSVSGWWCRSKYAWASAAASKRGSLPIPLVIVTMVACTRARSRRLVVPLATLARPASATPAICAYSRRGAWPGRLNGGSCAASARRFPSPIHC